MIKKILSRIARACIKKYKTETGASPLACYVDNSWSQNRLIRLGTHYGGWVIPADLGLNKDSVCYLAGAGEDISFDCALVQRFGCNVLTIDPTPRAIEHFNNLCDYVAGNKPFPINNSDTDFYDIAFDQLSQIHFLPVGLSNENKNLKFYFPVNPMHVSCSTVNLQKTESYFIAQCKRVKTIMEERGDNILDLLKIDIEGAEYSVITDVVNNGPLPKIFLIEFDEVHSPLDSGFMQRIDMHIKILCEAGMVCISAENSNVTLISKELL